MSEMLKPSAALLCKLASIAVHTEEFFSLEGHHLDKAAAQSLLNDPDVKAWLAAMTAASLAPQKRRP